MSQSAVRHIASKVKRVAQLTIIDGFQYGLTALHVMYVK